MKKFRSCLAACLVLFLVVCCLPVNNVLAATPGESTTEEPGDITIPIPPNPVFPEEEETVVTDLNGDEETDTDDAVYLLLNVMFGEENYPLPANADTDFNSDGENNTDDAVYLLLYVMFGEESYPLYP